MKKLLIPVMILCSLAAGCRSAEKTVGKITTDSISSLSFQSRTDMVLADSVVASGSLRFDSLVVEIRFDTAQRIVGKRYALTNFENSRREARRETFTGRDTSTVVSRSEAALRQETASKQIPAETGRFWKFIALTVLTIVGILFYRAFRG